MVEGWRVPAGRSVSKMPAATSSACTTELSSGYGAWGCIHGGAFMLAISDWRRVTSMQWDALVASDSLRFVRQSDAREMSRSDIQKLYESERLE